MSARLCDADDDGGKAKAEEEDDDGDDVEAGPSKQYTSAPDRFLLIHPIVVQHLVAAARRVLECPRVPRCASATRLHLAARECHRTASLGEPQADEARGAREENYQQAPVAAQAAAVKSEVVERDV